jgi:hypothetical protein
MRVAVDEWNRLELRVHALLAGRRFTMPGPSICPAAGAGAR